MRAHKTPQLGKHGPQADSLETRAELMFSVGNSLSTGIKRIVEMSVQFTPPRFTNHIKLLFSPGEEQ